MNFVNSPCLRKRGAMRRISPGSSTITWEKIEENIKEPKELATKFFLNFGWHQENVNEPPMMIGNLLATVEGETNYHQDRRVDVKNVCSGETTTKKSGDDENREGVWNWSAEAPVQDAQFAGTHEEDTWPPFDYDKDGLPNKVGWGRCAKYSRSKSSTDQALTWMGYPFPSPRTFVNKSRISWNLHRLDSDCGGYITMVKGDAHLNGKPLGKGVISLGPDSKIETGIYPSRVELMLFDYPGAIVWLGSDTKFEMKDPCKKIHREVDPVVLGKLWKGKIYAIITRIVGEKSHFEIKTGTAVNGIRGNLAPELYKQKPLKQAWLNLLLPNGAKVTTSEQDGVDITPEDLGTADIIVEIERKPGQFLRVSVLKGKAQVHNSHNYIWDLQSGETVRKAVPTHTDEQHAEYWITINPQIPQERESSDTVADAGLPVLEAPNAAFILKQDPREY